MNRFVRSRTFIILAAVLLQLTLWENAQAADVRVWVNTNSGVYHCPGAQYYGNTKQGEYLSESAAVTRGYRAAYHRPCSPAIANKATQNLIDNLAPSDAGDSIKVWINTGSHVYHCPGTRYYGATKHGRYASEAEAISGGNRAAYGSRCN
jgi:hypothetical protein